MLPAAVQHAGLSCKQSRAIGEQPAQLACGLLMIAWKTWGHAVGGKPPDCHILQSMLMTELDAPTKSIWATRAAASRYALSRSAWRRLPRFFCTNGAPEALMPSAELGLSCTSS